MKNIIRILSAYLLLACIALPVVAQDSVPRIDQRPVELRSFDRSMLEDYRQDDDFNYTMESSVPSGLSLWQRLLNWISRAFRNIFSIKVGEFELGKILMYVCVIAALAWAIYRLIKMNSRTLFNAPEKALAYEVSEENIHVLDFDSLLKEAVDTRQYQRAIRLTYLHALKLLTDGEHIHWQPGKTNHDYAAELTDQRIKSEFSALGYFFEYAWYGEFDINESHYRKTREIFSQLRRESNV